MFAPGQLPRGPKVETKKALLLIDLQNDFVDAKGKCYVPNTNAFLSKLPNLITAFRSKGPAVWIKTLYQGSVGTAADLSEVPNVILRSSLDQGLNGTVNTETGTTDIEDQDAFLTVGGSDQSVICCQQGTQGIESPEVLKSVLDRKKDLISWKSQYSAFADTMLVMQLRSRMVNDLYICGSLTNVGVFATVCDAVQQGFKVIVIEDCLGYRDEVCHTEAMKRMADDFGVEGIDYQELMDDIHGLLGDVIPATRFTRRMELSITPQGPPSTSRASRSQNINQWIHCVVNEAPSDQTPVPGRSEDESSIPPHERIETEWIEVASDEESSDSESMQTAPTSQLKTQPRQSPKASPPRKRSTSDRDDYEEASETPSLSESINQATQADSLITRTPTLKKSRIADSQDNKQRSSTTKPATDPSSTQPTQFLGQSKSANETLTRNALAKTTSNDRAQSHPNLSQPAQPQTQPSQVRQKKKATKPPIFASPTDTLGDGDCRVDLDILSSSAATHAFHKLKDTVKWQKMYHRTGEVPRLVAVQGEILPCGGIPIYRHPADESPPLLPFDSTVDHLRQICEQKAGHPLNHVLIQHYRTSEDNISEHSDKTLDIVRGSAIVNLSLGAMRTMTLRTKKAEGRDGEERRTQRIKLPNGSLFVLGQRTNCNWMHSIRADKRPVVEKSEEEKAFDGERISLTFRHIGTWIDVEEKVIWGQGATGKRREDARPMVVGEEADEVNEKMIIGFGKENHLSEMYFDWDKVYGEGFDVVNYEVKKGLG